MLSFCNEPSSTKQIAAYPFLSPKSPFMASSVGARGRSDLFLSVAPRTLPNLAAVPSISPTLSTIQPYFEVSAPDSARVRARLRA